MKRSANDARWKELNQQLKEYMSQGNWYALGNTYYQMAELVKKEGKDSTEYRDFGYKAKLKSQKEEIESCRDSGVVSSVEVSASDNSCDECKSINGMKCSLDDAERGKLLPVASCNQNFGVGCRCTYLPIVDE